jgi:hypothetical protein
VSEKGLGLLLVLEWVDPVRDNTPSATASVPSGGLMSTLKHSLSVDTSTMGSEGVGTQGEGGASGGAGRGESQDG